MKSLLDAGVAVVIGVAAIGIVISVVWGLRTSSEATSITVHEPEPGVHCALAITIDGVALDCWEVE